jgi:integrase/recombinase XerD
MYKKTQIKSTSKSHKKYILDDNSINKFKTILINEEKKPQTIKKYMRDIIKLKEYAAGRPVNKELLITYKEHLKKDCGYKTTSINSFLAVINTFVTEMGWNNLKIKMIKVQKETFVPENKEISINEYKALINAAIKKGDERLALIIQTLGSTGIRISELSYITVESLKNGISDIYNKGKVRRILYPQALQNVLKEYTKKYNIKNGVIFRTKNNKPLDRSNIWRMMKKLCKETNVSPKKVYPHNMRHMFARSFYKIKKDIAKLADVLGHSSIKTTRIYIKSTGKEHKRQLDMMNMVVLKNVYDHSNINYNKNNTNKNVEKKE